MKTEIKEFIHKVKNIWNPFERSLKINKYIYYYPKFYKKDTYEEFSNIDFFRIKDVKSRIAGNRIEIKITSSKPGLLIGNKEENLNTLTDYMKKKMGCDVKIFIEKCSLWDFKNY